MTMKTKEKNNHKEVSVKEVTNKPTVVESKELLNQRGPLRRKRTVRKKIKQFDRNSVINIVNDLQNAINYICTRYGANSVEVENVKFMNNDLEINGLHVRLPENIQKKKEMHIIDATSKERIGKEYKHGYRTYKVLSQEGDKFLVITRRKKKYLLSGEELDNMKLVG